MELFRMAQMRRGRENPDSKDGAKIGTEGYFVSELSPWATTLSAYVIVGPHRDAVQDIVNEMRRGSAGKLNGSSPLPKQFLFDMYKFLVSMFLASLPRGGKWLPHGNLRFGPRHIYVSHIASDEWNISFR